MTLPDEAGLFRHLFEAAPDATVIIDQAGKIELVNARAETLFGYSRSDLLGKPVEFLMPERLRDLHVSRRSVFMAAPKVRPMGSGLELFGLKADGSEFPIEISLSPLEIGGRMLVSSAIRDVTEQRRAEQKFRALLESAPDAIVIVDKDGRIVLVNAQAEALFGYARAELIGEAIEKLVPKRFRTQHQVHRRGYAHDPHARGMGSALQLFGLRRDGSEFPVEVSLSPLVTEEGTLVSSAIRDISERKRAEAAERLASDRLLSAVEAIQDPFALYDSDDRMVLCNGAYRELFSAGSDTLLIGSTFEAIFGESVKKGLFDRGSESTAAFQARCAGYHANQVGTLELRTLDGRHLRVTDRRTLEGGVVSTIWDVTENVQHESELTEARALAEAASSAKSEFLSSMSHELRTPLNAILGFAQLLQRDKKSPLSERQQEKLEYVLKGGEHLLRLIDDILDLSRIEAGRVTVSLEPVDVAQVLVEVSATLAPMASRAGITLVMGELAAPSAQVIADRTRFAQILINFGSNAIKYGKRGGHARFALSELNRGFLRVTITDDGIGIPTDKQDKIFQPFHRAGQETGPIEGTGIGLAISKRLAELMQGSVGFMSTPGGGSEFWIELPVHHVALALPTASQQSSRETGDARSASGTRTVVYIEDNPSNVAFMREVVAELDDVALIAVPNAEVGIEMVRERLPDIVIMDINLPGMSGYDATRRLGEWPETRDIPVVALSAAAMTGDRARAAAAGFYRYLTKPIKVAELLDTLDGILNPPQGSASVNRET
jgi:PAS domain S-box-containing protein